MFPESIIPPFPALELPVPTRAKVAAGCGRRASQARGARRLIGEQDLRQEESGDREKHASGERDAR
jgi:hypothetical protein